MREFEQKFARGRARAGEHIVRNGVRIEQVSIQLGAVLALVGLSLFQSGCLTHKSCNCDPDREYCVRYTSDDLGERYSFECRDLPDACVYRGCLCVEEHDEKISACVAESGSYCEETAAYIRFTCWEESHREVLRRGGQAH